MFFVVSLQALRFYVRVLGLVWSSCASRWNLSQVITRHYSVCMNLILILRRLTQQLPGCCRHSPSENVSEISLPTPPCQIWACSKRIFFVLSSCVVSSLQGDRPPSSLFRPICACHSNLSNESLNFLRNEKANRRWAAAVAFLLENRTWLIPNPLPPTVAKQQWQLLIELTGRTLLLT